MDDWRKKLSALKSIVIRFKVERREECSKELEANLEVFSVLKDLATQCAGWQPEILKKFVRGELVNDWTVLHELTDVLGGCKVSPEIARKSLALFNQLIDADHEFAVFLCYCCNVLSVVEQQLVDASVLDGTVSESLYLVQRICTNVAMPVMDPTVELIVQFLLSKIRQTGDPELLLPCLECLASLSCDNIAVQSAIKSQSSLKEINNKLIRLLSGSSSRVTLVTLHVLASLSLNSSLGEALFSTSNIEQTFGIIFNIFYHHGDDKTALSHAVDLMAVLLACERIRTAFVGYKHLRACVQSTLTLLVRSRGESAGKLCELFQAFLSVPELHQMIVNTFFGPLCNVDKRRSEGAHGAGQGHENNLVVTCLFSMMGGGQEGGVQWGGAARRCTSRALDLLREVMEGAVACGLLQSVLLLLPALLPVLQQQLTASVPDRRGGGTWLTQHSQLEAVELTLAVLITVSEIDTAPGEVVRSLTPGVVRRVWSLVQSAPARPWWAASLPKGQNEGAVLGQRCFEDVKVGVTTKLLHLCILVCGASNAFNSLLCHLLQEGDVMALVARGLLSDDSSTVGRALRVIQHTDRIPTFTSHGLRDSMMTACAHHTQAVQEREKLKALQVRGRQTASSLSTSGSRHHDNSSTNGPCASVRSSSSAKIAQSPLESVQDGGVSTPPQPSGKKSENPPLEVDIEAVEELIKKMKTGVGKLQDARASEIMMVYECKLQNMMTKETHLQELLEAKANALFHADRLNSQYRGKVAQTEAECMKLRKLLQQAEKTNEKSQEQATRLQDMHDQSQKEKAALNKKVAHFTDEANKLRAVVAEYEAVKKDLATTKSRLEDAQKAKVRLDHKLLAAGKKNEELEQMGERHRAEQIRLQKLLHQAEEEKSELSLHITAQEKQFKELKSGIAVFEQRVFEMEALHREDLQRGEELSSQLALAHREKAHILEQKNLLQEDCQRMEVCIEEQKKEIDQLHRENEILQNKFRHIQSVLGDGLMKTR